MNHIQNADLEFVTGPAVNRDTVIHKSTLYKIPRHFPPFDFRLSTFSSDTQLRRTNLPQESTNQTFQESSSKQYPKNTLIIIPAIKMRPTTKTTHVVCRETCKACGKPYNDCTCAWGN